MKKYLLLLFSIFIFGIEISFSQTAGEWTWMNGDTLMWDSGHYGIQGVQDLLNHPPNLFEATTWTDNQGKFWLYAGTYPGGYFYGDLWKYDVLLNMWTWINGTGHLNANPVYGIKGVPALTNYPGTRGLNSCAWTDSNNNLWMFGGIGKESQGTNDLWKYNISTNMWTWMSGDTTAPMAVYGTQGVPSIFNVPPPRDETSSAWIDGNQLWLFGGALDYGGFPPPEHYNDLWRYDLITGEWTWMKGANSTNSPAVYGIQGIADPANTPISLWSYSHWKDQNGNFWIFGGSFYWGYGNTNELWKYNPSLNEWTWMAGSNIANGGTYYTYCVSDTSSIPSSRYMNTACWTDSCGMFWMYGGSQGYNGHPLNDLWRYNSSVNQWTWVDGDTSSSVGNLWHFGLKGISSPSNQPGDIGGASSWLDLNGNLWLYGGYSDLAQSSTVMWRYIPDPFCGGCLQTTIDKQEKKYMQFQISPNPAISIVIISATAQFQKGEIEIFNLLGEKVNRCLFPNGKNEITIDVSNLSQGLYFVKVQTEKGYSVQKLIIQ